MRREREMSCEVARVGWFSPSRRERRAPRRAAHQFLSSSLREQIRTDRNRCALVRKFDESNLGFEGRVA